MSRYFIPNSRRGACGWHDKSRREPKPWQRASDHTRPYRLAWWARTPSGWPSLWHNPERRAEREEARRLGISRKLLRKQWKREARAA